MAQRAFLAEIEQGDGRAVRVHRMTCGGCGVIASFRNSQYGDATSAEQVPKKFRARGWAIGAKASEDRCPECVRGGAAARRAARNKTVSNDRSEPAKPVAAAHTAQAALVADPPKQMTRADRRRVAEALDEHYPVPERGYANGLTDEGLARRLDVPRAWVSRVREEEFGPETVVEWARLKKETDEAVAACRQVAERLLEAAAAAERRAVSLQAKFDDLRARIGGAA